MPSNYEVLKVHPEFHKKIKMKASEQGMSVIKYTESLCRVEDVLRKEPEREEKKDAKKNFRFSW